MIRVLVADDQTLVRCGLVQLLGLVPDLEVVGEASDGEEVLRRLPELDPDVLLLDVRMPRAGGLDVLREVGARRPVVLLTTFDDDEAMLEAARLGAKGFLLKDTDLDVLADAIRTAASGGTTIRPALTRKVEEALPKRVFRAARDPDPLTPRERDVLRLMAAGCSNREIANALGTAEGTVKNQCSSVLAKLGVRDRTRAVLRALELGWI
ncbi:MAG: response regulator transcription factor [Alphaproteobacteria bacterium]|nr:response regulator transcription factor [Alphaproteobacteria bacterium]MCB9696007.1 response regulator transcription factor [Alphaproteobacteria bacterium]